jgi:hypothetical protein
MGLDWSTVWSVISSVASTGYQTLASGVQTVYAGVASAVGADDLANAFYDDAMNNSVAGQVLNSGGSLGEATAATDILGATATTAATLPASVVGGEALLGAYGAGSIGPVTYAASNAALNASLSAAGNAVTQLGTSGTIDPSQLAVSAALGGVFEMNPRANHSSRSAPCHFP